MPRLKLHPSDAAASSPDATARSAPTPKRRRRLPPLVADAKRLSPLLGGVGIRSIRTWDAGGRLPRPIKLGARTVWLLSEVKAWLRAGAPDRAEWERLRRAARR